MSVRPKNPRGQTSSVNATGSNSCLPSNARDWTFANWRRRHRDLSGSRGRVAAEGVAPDKLDIWQMALQKCGFGRVKCAIVCQSVPRGELACGGAGAREVYHFGSKCITDSGRGGSGRMPCFAARSWNRRMASRCLGVISYCRNSVMYRRARSAGQPRGTA